MALVLNLLEIILLLTAFRITTTNAVKGVIGAYRAQSYLLAVITGLTAWYKGQVGSRGFGLAVLIVSLFLIVLLPASLGGLIEGLLARATIAFPGARIWPTSAERRAAERIWLKREGTGTSLFALLIFGGLIALAFWIAFQAIPQAASFGPSEKMGLMVSLSLHLIGLYNMVVKGDIVSQAIGLLTMDHGLYLAVVKIVTIPVPAVFFVVGLYFYTLITLVILVFLLPQVRSVTESIDLDEITADSKLEG
jgi:hydrogenase-4 membrane subunit HyfE